MKMFTRIKFTIAANKLIKSMGGNPKNPTINEMIVAGPILLLSAKRKHSPVFSNNYVCADAILITCEYAMKILEGTGAPDYVTSDIKDKMASAIQREFSISGSELLEMQKNRLSFFGRLLDKHPNDISPMIEEAALVFSYDLAHDRYVEYAEDSPLIILGIDKQMQIESEALEFFNAALKLVTDYISQYFL